jgi:hypothetical protein
MLRLFKRRSADRLDEDTGPRAGPLTTDELTVDGMELRALRLRYTTGGPPEAAQRLGVTPAQACRLVKRAATACAWRLELEGCFTPCPDRRNAIVTYVAGVDERSDGATASHVDACAACARAADELEQAARQLTGVPRAADLPPVELSVDVPYEVPRLRPARPPLRTRLLAHGLTGRALAPLAVVAGVGVITVAVADGERATGVAPKPATVARSAAQDGVAQAGTPAATRGGPASGTPAKQPTARRAADSQRRSAAASQPRKHRSAKRRPAARTRSAGRSSRAVASTAPPAPTAQTAARAAPVAAAAPPPAQAGTESWAGDFAP